MEAANGRAYHGREQMDEQRRAENTDHDLPRLGSGSQARGPAAASCRRVRARKIKYRRDEERVDQAGLRWRETGTRQGRRRGLGAQREETAVAAAPHVSASLAARGLGYSKSMSKTSSSSCGSAPGVSSAGILIRCGCLVHRVILGIVVSPTWSDPAEFWRLTR